jgi:hypothetical protein
LGFNPIEYHSEQEIDLIEARLRRVKEMAQ